MRLNARQTAWLRLYTPETIGIELPADADRRALQVAGLIDWLPGAFGGSQWAITDKGRAAITETTN